jgi:prepilin-type N-terminal cleavage/methylation domain-containing protein
MNKKGFTLIEILAVITIIGILGIITVSNIYENQTNSKSKLTEIEKNNIISAAKNYAASNITKLPQNVGDSITVDVKTLIDDGYLEEESDYINRNVIIEIDENGNLSYKLEE